MRKIDTWTLGALNGCAGVYQNANTVVRVFADRRAVVELHENKIFYRDASGRVFFTLAGWNTQTTRARLNALLCGYGVHVYTVSGCAYCRTVTTEQKPIEKNRWYTVDAGAVEEREIELID